MTNCEKNIVYQTYEHFCINTIGKVPIQLDLTNIEKARQVIHETIVDYLTTKQTKSAINMAYEIKLFDMFILDQFKSEMQKDVIEI